jgi:hypothetical protein
MIFRQSDKVGVGVIWHYFILLLHRTCLMDYLLFYSHVDLSRNPLQCCP